MTTPASEPAARRDEGKRLPNHMIERSAAAIANARGNRRGVPTLANVLDILPATLRDAVLEDAEVALSSAGVLDLLEAAKAALAILSVESDPPGLFDSGEPPGADIDALHEKLSAAIAKAESRS